MSKKLALFALFSIGGIVAAFGAPNPQSWTMTLSTTNQLVAPALAGYTAITATNTVTYSAGDYVTMPNGRTYWTPNGGQYLTAQAPTHRQGIVTKATGVKWLHLGSSRKDLTIQITQSGVDVWFVEGGAGAVSGSSRLLVGRGMAWVFDDYSGPMYALAGSGTATITVTER